MTRTILLFGYTVAILLIALLSFSTSTTLNTLSQSSTIPTPISLSIADMISQELTNNEYYEQVLESSNGETNQQQSNQLLLSQQSNDDPEPGPLPTITTTPFNFHSKVIVGRFNDLPYIDLVNGYYHHYTVNITSPMPLPNLIEVKYVTTSKGTSMLFTQNILIDLVTLDGFDAPKLSTTSIDDDGDDEEMNTILSLKKTTQDHYYYTCSFSLNWPEPVQFARGFFNYEFYVYLHLNKASRSPHYTGHVEFSLGSTVAATKDTWITPPARFEPSSSLSNDIKIRLKETLAPPHQSQSKSDKSSQQELFDKTWRNFEIEVRTSTVKWNFATMEDVLFYFIAEDFDQSRFAQPNPLVPSTCQINDKVVPVRLLWSDSMNKSIIRFEVNGIPTPLEADTSFVIKCDNIAMYAYDLGSSKSWIFQATMFRENGNTKGKELFISTHYHLGPDRLWYSIENRDLHRSGFIAAITLGLLIVIGAGFIIVQRMGLFCFKSKNDQDELPPEDFGVPLNGRY